MKLIKAATENEAQYNCNVNLKLCKHFFPAFDDSKELFFYAELIKKPINLFDIYTVSNGVQTTAFGNVLFSKDANGNYYFVGNSFIVNEKCFSFKLVAHYTDSTTETFYSQQFVKDCNGSDLIKSCYNNGGFDSNGIYCGEADQSFFYGDPQLKYLHQFYVRSSSVLFTNTKTEFTKVNNRPLNYSNTKEYEFTGEAVPLWYSENLEAMFNRGTFLYKAKRYFINAIEFTNISKCCELVKMLVKCIFQKSDQLGCEVKDCEAPICVPIEFPLMPFTQTFCKSNINNGNAAYIQYYDVPFIGSKFVQLVSSNKPAWVTNLQVNYNNDGTGFIRVYINTDIAPLNSYDEFTATFSNCGGQVSYLFGYEIACCDVGVSIDTLPIAYVGVPYYYEINIISGTALMPNILNITSIPSGLTVTNTPSKFIISGTPTSTNNQTIEFEWQDCSGIKSYSNTLEIQAVQNQNLRIENNNLNGATIINVLFNSPPTAPILVTGNLPLLDGETANGYAVNGTNKTITIIWDDVAFDGITNRILVTKNGISIFSHTITTISGTVTTPVPFTINPTDFIDIEMIGF
jgi:hypothetical protein